MARCNKPYCGRPGSVVLSYDYGARTASLDDPPRGELSPHLYLLCAHCADRLSPPRGWQVKDRRAVRQLFWGSDPVSDGEDEPVQSSERAVDPSSLPRREHMTEMEGGERRADAR